MFQIHKNKKVRPSANKLNLIKNINDLLITLLSLVIVSHIMACSWIFISSISLQYQIDGPATTSWIQNGSPAYNTLDNMRLYFVAFYYTITTMTTVGYGDVVGVNTLERLISIINEVVGVIVFSVIVSKLANIASLNDLNDADHLEYKNKLALIEDIDTRFEMSLDLKVKLID